MEDPGMTIKEEGKESTKDTIFFVDQSTADAVNQEAQGQGGQKEEAFNEETGEINWDCPCLGPMTQPPCGETFKAAFSCFVYSKEEPKGADCVDLFRSMQDCFREHPEIYGSELEEEEDAQVINKEAPSPSMA